MDNISGLFVLALIRFDVAKLERSYVVLQIHGQGECKFI